MLGYMFLACVSCQPSELVTGDFRILPSPLQFEITGASGLTPDGIQTYWAMDQIELPPFLGPLTHLKPAESVEEADVVFSL